MSACIMQGKTLMPIEYKVIVLPDLIEETDEAVKSAKALGIVMLDKDTDREKLKQVSGTLVSVGGNAFQDMSGLVPKVGDKVYYAKYAGLILKSDDGTDYRMMNDKDLTAVLV
jgi:co-chaperonin GroES (HSP10)